MIKAYDYLYFGLYRLFLNSKNYNDVAEYIAFFALSGCFAVDIFMLSLPLTSNAWKHVPVKITSITFILLIGIINYFYFVRSGKYLKLVEEYKNTSPKKLLTMDRVAIAFCALSFASPFLFGIVKYYLS